MMQSVELGTTNRLHSLDALRGLDMLFIIGLDSVIRAVSPFFCRGKFVRKYGGSWGTVHGVDWRFMISFFRYLCSSAEYPCTTPLPERQREERNGSASPVSCGNVP